MPVVGKLLFGVESFDLHHAATLDHLHQAQRANKPTRYKRPWVGCNQKQTCCHSCIIDCNCWRGWWVVRWGEERSPHTRVRTNKHTSPPMPLTKSTLATSVPPVATRSSRMMTRSPLSTEPRGIARVSAPAYLRRQPGTHACQQSTSGHCCAVGLLRCRTVRWCA